MRSIFKSPVSVPPVAVTVPLNVALPSFPKLNLGVLPPPKKSNLSSLAVLTYSIVNEFAAVLFLLLNISLAFPVEVFSFPIFKTGDE